MQRLDYVIINNLGLNPTHRYILIILMFQYALTRHRGPMTGPVRILPKCPITASKNSLFSN